MADKTTNLPIIAQGSGSQDIQANGLFDAASPSMRYGRNAVGCTGRTWAYFGGNVTK